MSGLLIGFAVFAACVFTPRDGCRIVSLLAVWVVLTNLLDTALGSLLITVAVAKLWSAAPGPPVFDADDDTSPIPDAQG